MILITLLVLAKFVSSSQGQQDYHCLTFKDEQSCLQNKCEWSGETCKDDLYNQPFSSKDGGAMSLQDIIIIVIGVIIAIFLLIFFVKFMKSGGENRNEVQNTTDIEMSQKVSDIISALPSVEYVEVAEKQVCTVCLDNLREGELTTLLACTHSYHKSCIEKWIRTKGTTATCPVCNFKISPPPTDSR
eukprot:TRINITY_DN19408_c0_g1_i6.p1 TRINITY_DN19408_c0_g1~~TRINITY_DN19408_c0_g1_i6.p1  ORF type:complete len:187 (-),score=3.98 TRINITY_DN19408_c0_g1_i6:473-1033(-)